jgi:hypothetical protein
MSQVPNASSTAAPRRASLRREIIAVLGFKLLALLALYFLFFHERPVITPKGVEHRVLGESPPVRTAS